MSKETTYEQTRYTVFINFYYTLVYFLRNHGPAFKEADELVKNGIYDKALEKFLAIWENTNNPAAGVNAAILYEVTGSIDLGLDLLKSVMDVSIDKKVTAEYQRMLKVIEDQEKLAEQLE